MPTYTPLQSIELTAATASVTFSGIPQIYQDLVIIGNVQLTSSGQSFLYQYNGDTATNYSLTILKGNGTSATSDRRSSINYQLAAGWDAGLPTSTSYASGIINIQNYSNTTTNKTSIARGSNAAGGDVTSTVCLWRNTAAITSITLYTGTGSLAAGSTFDLYGISPVAADTAQAFGGTDVYYDSTYVYHVFKGSGTFTPYRALTADVLMIAGGGAGGYGYGAGGGAGGVSYSSSQSLTANTSYTVTVGAGGVGRTTEGQGASGSNSQFGSLTAAVGGGGGGGGLNGNGANGGSGGGGARDTGTGGTATSGQGNAGRNASSGSYAGGGGGAGATGDTSGNGGAGTSTYSSWGLTTGIGQNVSGTYFFAGGGAGYRADAAATTGGSGGGGNSGSGAGTAMTGTAFTGGGGGAWDASALPSGSGGSGIVIVRYAR